MTLGQPTATSYEDALITLKALLNNGHQAMFAGGCVRDRLLGIRPADFDIATSANPNDTMTLFASLGYRVIPTGFDHGTVTVVTPSGSVEITTLRCDVKTDGRHAVVEFDGATFESDAARRDFTINAMFEDVHSTVHDFFNGLSDLKAKTLKFVGAPAERIREDYLRILRFFRFWARFGFTPDPVALQAITVEAAGLAHVSQERITSELWGTWSGVYACDALKGMEGCHVTKLVCPESVPINHSLSLILRDTSMVTMTIRPWLVLALCLGILQGKRWTEDDVHTFSRRLRMSEKDARTLMDVFYGWDLLPKLTRDISDALDLAEHLEHHGQGPDFLEFYAQIWAFLARHSRDQNLQEAVAWLVTADQTFGERRKMPLPVTGRDIMEIHPSLAGSRIGDAMTLTRKSFRNGHWRTRQEGLNFLRNQKF